MNCGQALDMFILDKTVSNLSPETVKDYQTVVGAFVNWLGSERNVVDLTDGLLLKQYILVLQQRNLTGKTIHTYVKHIKVYFRWLFTNGHIDSDPARDLRIKYEKKIPDVLTMDEIQALIDIPSLRDRLIVCLLLDCGLRRREIISVDMADIVNGRLHVRLGKGKKDRIVPLSEPLQDMIRLYDQERDQTCPALIQTLDGRRLSTQGIHTVFRRLKKKTGIERLHAHLLRHTYGTYFVDSGGDIKSLQLLMGHADVKTTETYVHIANLLHVEKYAKHSIFNIVSQQKDIKKE